MSIPRLKYACKSCGHVHDKWGARCESCTSWGLEQIDPHAAPIVLRVPDPPAAKLAIVPSVTTETEQLTPAAPSRVQPNLPPKLSDVKAETFVRLATGIEPLDAVLGGGLVVGASVLIAAPRGIGKSTLVLQAITALNLPALYVSAEEPISFIGERARRCRLDIDQVYVISDRTMETIFEAARAADVRVVVIDSIQKMRCADHDSREGSATQIKLCAERIQQFGHENGVAMLVIGQMTSDDKIAGPKQLEHEVDVILELEAVGKAGNTIKLRCDAKNRCGATNVVGRFKMTSNGLVPFKSGDPGAGEVDGSDDAVDDEDDDEPNIH